MGSVTAETAVALPALMVVAVLAAWLVAAVAAEVRCVDAARLGARALARGDPAEQALAEASRAAPRDAQVRVRLVGGDVEVEVVGLVGPGVLGIPPVRVGATARAPVEPGVAGSEGAAVAGGRIPPRETDRDGTGDRAGDALAEGSGRATARSP